MTDIKSGIGIHSLWGYGPSQNLMEFCSGCLPKSNVDAINILLVQPCDPRHIIHTISRQCDKRSKGQQRPIRFYIIEPQIEILARSILLLNIFFRKEIPIRHRAALFLEVYGNTLIQEKTESILHEMGTNLTNMVYGDKFDGHLGNILDLSALKQRDRDALVDTFKSWRTDVMFDITSLRDHRLRGYYQDRYDCRQNVMDWDYHARVKKVASIIHTKQWRTWRNIGIAYEFGNSTYSAPNRSLSTFAEGTTKSGTDRGIRKEFKGFWGDILVGPFNAFGVECDLKRDTHASDLFHIVNEGTGSEQHRHHTVEVALYNMIGYMWTVETGEKYAMKKAGDIFSGLGEDASTGSKISTKIEGNASKCNIPLQNLDGSEEITADYTGNEGFKDEALNGIEVIPLSGNFRSLLEKKKFKDYFHHIYFSQQAAHFLECQQLKSILRNRGSSLSIETGKYIHALAGDEQQTALTEKILQMAEVNGLKVSNNQGNISDVNLLQFLA